MGLNAFPRAFNPLNDPENIYVHACIGVHTCMNRYTERKCVCVRERESESERKRERKTKKEQKEEKNQANTHEK